MAEHTAQIIWKRGESENFSDNKYSRAHTWRFDGGAEVRGSSAPNVVKPPMSDPAGVDPEEAFIASLSSCHMLWFLALAGKQQFVVDSYTDDAVGVMEKNAEGRIAMTRVTLRPTVQFSGDRQPTREQLDALHHDAHDKCFIANSVKSEVTVEPRV